MYSRGTLFHEARLHHQLAQMDAERKVKETGNPLQRQTIKGDVAHRMNRYIRKRCGVSSILEKDYEVDSLGQSSVEA